MKVLTIDLDYIMAPWIEVYQDHAPPPGSSRHSSAIKHWTHVFNSTQFRESMFYIDQPNLLFCFNTFLKSIKNCESVSFGYDHDSILYDIAKFDNIDLINIDHHDDFFHGIENDGPDDLGIEDEIEAELSLLKRFDHVNEGNWGAWLHLNGKLNSFTWICNPNSANRERDSITEKITDFKSVFKEDYEFENYDFDHIFICLSPDYTPRCHWHYFTMFINAFEEFTGKNAIIHTSKFEIDNNIGIVHNEILHQRANGGRPLSGSGLREWTPLRK
jgi:hypothetical protein|tara:strand:+ start:228 stop:1046 length:819 start_codon:yes stop_codon:yes gene_type:complete